MKLELKHIAPYLPYGLDAINKDNKQMAIMGCLDKQTVVAVNNGCLRGYDLKYVKPILRPLSDITEAEARSFLKLAHGGLINFTEINIYTIDEDDLYLSSELSSGTMVCLRANHTLDGLCISVYSISTRDETTTYPTHIFIYNLFFEHHFDVFNLIENNLAIDKTNNYENK